MAASGERFGGVRVAVLTVSDGVAGGRRQDRAGDSVAAALARLGWRLEARAVVADEREAIGAWLRAKSQGEGAVDLVLTLGGTGLGPRDVTPEATAPVLERPVPGLAEALRQEGARQTLAAYLSRGVAGLCGRTLIVNVPGSVGAAEDAMRLLAQLVPHALHVGAGGGHEPEEGTRAARPPAATAIETGSEEGRQGHGG